MHPTFSTLMTAVPGMLLGLLLGRYIWVVAFAYERLWHHDAAELARKTAAPTTDTAPDLRLLRRALLVSTHLMFDHPRNTLLACLTWTPAALLAIAYVLAALYTTSTLLALALMWATAVLLLLSLIDVRTQFLPDALTLPLLWTGLALSLLDINPVPLTEALAAVMIAYTTLWVIAWGFRFLRGRDGMGGGDIKLLAAIGAWVGWPDVFLALLCASLSGICTAFLIARSKYPNEPYPFGPHLASAAIALLWLRALGITD